MAIVPDYGGPQVSPSVGAGTQGAQFQAMVAPKADPLAPMQKALDKVGRMQAALLEEQDDAIATDIDTKYAQYCQQLLNDPDKGFMSLKGRAAVAPNDGEAPIDTMMNKAGDYLKALMEGRTKDQIARIKAKTNSRTNGLYASGMQHAMAENVNYNRSTYEAAISNEMDAAQADYNSPDKLDAHIARIKGYAAKLSQYTGENPKEKTRTAVAGALKNAALGYLFAASNDPTMYAQTLDFVQRHSKQMRPQDVFSLGTQANEGMRNYEAVMMARQGMEALTPATDDLSGAMGAIVSAGSATKNSSMQGAEHYILSQGIKQGSYEAGEDGRVQIRVTKKAGEDAFGAAAVTRTMAEAVAGKKLTDAEWKAIREDETEGMRVGQTFLGMMGQKYGEQEKSVAAYVGSQKEVDDAVARAKKEGGIWSQYLSKETLAATVGVFKQLDTGAAATSDGYASTIFDNRKTAANFQPIDAETMRRYARNHPLSINPDWEDRVVRYMERYESERRSAYTAEHAAAVNAACSEYEQKGEINPQTLMRLTAKERVAVRNYCKELDAGGNTTSAQYAAYLNTNLDELRNFSRDELENALRLCPKSARQSLRKEWEKGRGMTQEQMRAQYMAGQGVPVLGKTSVKMTMVQSVLNALLPGYKKLKPDQKATIAQGIMTLAGMEAAIDGIDLKDPNKAEQWIYNLIGKNVYTTSGILGTSWGADQKSIFEFTYGDLPSKAKAVANKLALLTGHGREMSPGAKTAGLVNFLLLKDLNVDVTGIVDNDMRRTVRAMEFKRRQDESIKKNNGRADMAKVDKETTDFMGSASDNEILRMYLESILKGN